MRRIFKYPLPVEDEFTLALPAGAELLAVQTQVVSGTETPMLWALVNEALASQTRRFAVHGTGHAIEDAELLRYVGTFQLVGGTYVGHLFEHLA